MGNGGIQECEGITHVLWCVLPEFYDITHITIYYMYYKYSLERKSTFIDSKCQGSHSLNL